MPTIAFVGGDGAGKSTVTAKLMEELPFPVKYMYMGMSSRSTNIALPTHRIARYVKEFLYRRSQAKIDTKKPVDIEQMYEGFRHRDRRGKLGATARLANRLAEEWFRQLVSWTYQLRGYVVLYDRHFIFDFPERLPGKPDERLSDRLHRWQLHRVYPHPDLVIFLDAPPALLYERKGEATLEYLESARNGYIRQGTKVKNFLTIDASRPLDVVYADVRHAVEAFVTPKRSS